jgi:hypothetical protein
MQKRSWTSCDVPDIMGNARMRATKSEPSDNDIGAMMCCWWIRFWARLNIADIE